MCSAEKSVNVRTLVGLVGVAGRDWACWSLARSDGRETAGGEMLVGEGLRVCCEYTWLCSCCGWGEERERVINNSLNYV